MVYEILNGTAVINTIEADADFMSEAFPGGNYRAVPVVPAATAVVRTLPAGAFRLRFTFKERVAVELASVINPAATAQAQQTQANVRTFYADLNSQRTINLDSPSVLQGCTLLSSLNILELGWKARIIDANPTPAELGYGS